MDFATPQKRPRGESIVPMINVVFLLLVFFLMTSQLTPPEPIEVTPPNATGDEGPPVQLTLFMGPDGGIAFRDLTGDAALDAYAAEGTGATEPPMLRADAQAEARAVARVLKNLAARGLTNVALVVAPE
ncbi:biopolymer transporter ExbD [Pseudooceanicola sp. LIPI14-2-Ac024]|uniref:biopolymer transporter ExbD n=1 Tax=Pseudooceanicola sp. LIPI14-2-Ac024 TaxID=3344875 RepID=UPI0035D0A38A